MLAFFEVHAVPKVIPSCSGLALRLPVLIRFLHIAESCRQDLLCEKLKLQPGCFRWSLFRFALFTRGLADLLLPKISLFVLDQIVSNFW